MNTAELIYQNVKTLPEFQAQEVLKFIDFLKFKQQSPNQTTIEAMQATNRGEYETVSLDELKNQEQEVKQSTTSFGAFLKQFRQEVEADPIDIDTTIFDSYRKSVTIREFTWED
jgi:predicted ATP-binding protein involved in virulence